MLCGFNLHTLYGLILLKKTLKKEGKIKTTFKILISKTSNIQIILKCLFPYFSVSQKLVQTFTLIYRKHIVYTALETGANCHSYMSPETSVAAPDP